MFYATHERIWLALAYTGFFINLFNLVPISPLDGGRIAQMFSRRAWIVGPDTLSSQCKESPFAGLELTGRVVRTLAAGRTIHAA